MADNIDIVTKLRGAACWTHKHQSFLADTAAATIDELRAELTALQRRLEAPVEEVEIEAALQWLAIWEAHGMKIGGEESEVQAKQFAQVATMIRDLHRRLTEAQEKLVEVSKNYSEEIARQQNRTRAEGAKNA